MSITKILLKEFSQRGVLYHFTTFGKATLIGKENRLKPNKAENAISLTRNYALDDFGRIRIALDGDKLSENYKIEPFLFQGKGYKGYDDDPEKMRQRYRKEAEERIVGKDIFPLDRYIIQIDVFSRAIRGYKKISELKKVKAFKTIPINMVQDWKPVKHNRV